VHFNTEGLNHLLYSRRRPRGYQERYYRAVLIAHLVDVVMNAKTATQKTTIDGKTIHLWSLEYKIGNDIVKVILRKVGNGNVHFLSAMKRKSGKNKKNL